MADNSELSVGGFLFDTEKDALLAEAELKKIEYLEARIDYSKPENILLVYEKAIHERIFKTPIGLQYLQKLRDFLLNQPQIEKERIPDIAIYTTFYTDVKADAKPLKTKVRNTSEDTNRKTALFISIVFNVVLVLAVIAMFTIALRSDNPNMLNYKKAITNQYATWEQELTQREQVIREKERELRLENQQ